MENSLSCKFDDDDDNKLQASVSPRYEYMSLKVKVRSGRYLTKVVAVAVRVR